MLCRESSGVSVILSIVPNSDAAGEEALCNAAVEVSEDIEGHTKLLQPRLLMHLCKELWGAECLSEVLRGHPCL